MLGSLAELSLEMAGVALVVVVPKAGMCFQVRHTSGDDGLPEFCRMVQQSEDGKKQCQHCWQVMASQADDQAPYRLQQCHAGVFSLEVPVPGTGVVLGLCGLAVPNTVLQTKDRTYLRTLGVNGHALDKAYGGLTPYEENTGPLAVLIKVLEHSVREKDQLHRMEKELNRLKQQAQPSGPEPVDASVEAVLRSAIIVLDGQHPASVHSSDLPPAISAIASLVEHNPSLPYRVAELAQTVRMSPNYFSDIFSRHMGETFTHFLNRKRIDLAKQLLVDFRLSIAEVSSQAGYEDASYFSRRFQRATGQTPKAWRKDFIPEGS